MLTIKQLEEKAKLENLKIRLESLDRDLMYKNINNKQYEKEKKLIFQEVCELEIKNGIKNEYDNPLNDLFNNPMMQIENLTEEAKGLVKWKQK